MLSLGRGRKSLISNRMAAKVSTASQFLLLKQALCEPLWFTLAALQVEEIDLSQSEDVVLAKMRNACTSNGFTILRNHGIGQELLDAALANCEAFFSLPEEKKESLKMLSSR